MRFVFLTFFLSIIVLKTAMPAMDTYELAKLPTLFEHFSEHRKENPDLSFWDYLTLHYENPNHHQEDHQKHSTLPFGNHHHDTCSLQVWFSNAAMPPSLTPSVTDSLLTDGYTMLVNHSFSTSIWQPPKQA